MPFWRARGLAAEIARGPDNEPAVYGGSWGRKKDLRRLQLSAPCYCGVQNSSCAFGPVLGLLVPTASVPLEQKTEVV